MPYSHFFKKNWHFILGITKAVFDTSYADDFKNSKIKISEP